MELSFPYIWTTCLAKIIIKIIQRICSDLEQWSILPLSLLGRVEYIRMNAGLTLPYLFQMIPVEIPKTMFDKLNERVLSFR